MAAPATGGIAQSTLDVSLNAPPLSGGGGQASVTRYTTQRGETLQTIARAVYGDARLWYRLADANGLAMGPDQMLLEGESLTVHHLALSANSVDTFQPYDPSNVTGNTSAMLPDLPMPAQGGGCGAMGQIIMMVITAVVAYYTAGAVAGAIETTTGGTATVAGVTGCSGFQSMPVCALRRTTAPSFAPGRPLARARGAARRPCMLLIQERTVHI